MIERGAWLLFLLGLLLLAAVYYVGFVSDTLAFAKVGQQVGYFLTARKSDGSFVSTTPLPQKEPGDNRPPEG